MPRHVYLVGFMGSGKSTVGPLLAQELSWPFLDLDSQIEFSLKLTIQEIFSRYGEAFFRELERRQLKETALLAASTVVALGGGTFCREGNQEFLRQYGISIWLDLPVETAWQRCQQIRNRPLARDWDSFRKLFLARAAHYARADVRIDTTNRTPQQICQEILQALEQHDLLPLEGA